VRLQTGRFSNLPTGNYTIVVYDGWGCRLTTLPIFYPRPHFLWIADLLETLAPVADEAEWDFTIV